MTTAESTNNIPFRRNFLGFRFKKGRTPKRHFAQPDVLLRYDYGGPHIPRQAHNPAIYPLLAKPVAREENFVLLPIRNVSTKRKRDPNSPVRTSIKQKGPESDTGEWTRYLSSYAEGRGKPGIRVTKADRQALRKYYKVVRPSDRPTTPGSTRSEVDRFQRLVVAARQTFGTKIALLSLVDEKRQFFKCEAGLGMCDPFVNVTHHRNVETDREITFCGHTILSNEPMVVLDAEKDWRLAENPLVTGWPYVRFYAGAPIITLQGYVIGTVCVIDTEPRESFDVNQRRKLTEFARLAMDEIELAMRKRESKEQSDSSKSADPSDSVPLELRGMTAIASEAGTIDASIAGKDIRKAVKAIDTLEVIESAVTMAEKDGDEQLKFKYGRNSSSEIEVGARGVERATRKVGETKAQGKAVRVESPPHPKRASSSRGKAPESSRPSYASAREHEKHDVSAGYASDPEIRPQVRPKSSLRPASYAASRERSSIPSKDVDDDNLDITADDQLDLGPKAVSSVGRDSPSPRQSRDFEASVMPPSTPAMPTYFDLQTKSNPELAAQLIARALRVDFVYFMRLTPITSKSPNVTGYPNAEVNLEILGCYGLPFPTISFSPFTHLEALRSELGMIYYSNVNESSGEASESNIANAKDYFKVGIVVPVWREYPRSSLTSSTGTSTRARAGSLRGSQSGRRSPGSSSTTSTTIASLRESCRKGVVVGVFSKRGERKTFTRIEREYLKQWVSLRDHI